MFCSSCCCSHLVQEEEDEEPIIGEDQAIETQPKPSDDCHILATEPVIRQQSYSDSTGSNENTVSTINVSVSLKKQVKFSDDYSTVYDCDRSTILQQSNESEESIANDSSSQEKQEEPWQGEKGGESEESDDYQSETEKQHPYVYTKFVKPKNSPKANIKKVNRKRSKLANPHKKRGKVGKEPNFPNQQNVMRQGDNDGNRNSSGTSIIPQV